MKIAISVQAYHPGNTSDYVLRALTQLGHQAQIVSCVEMVKAHKAEEFDLYFCVDSGEPLQLAELENSDLSNVGFWNIDFRHNKDRANRNDRQVVRFLAERGTKIFQACHEDMLECKQMGLSKCYWLPMAADPEVWSPALSVQKEFELGFVGNVWDEGRLKVLRSFEGSGIKTAFVVNRKLSALQAASVLNRCKLAFNVNSFYGAPFAYDLNMRFFESMSCGLPLVTCSVPAISRVLPNGASFLREYYAADQIIPLVRDSIESPDFMQTGQSAREWILAGHTYRHRILDALDIMTQRNGN